MRKDAYYLINHFHDADKVTASEMYKVAEEVNTALLEGLSTIGNLMHHASENKEYTGAQVKRDLNNMGLLIKHIARISAGIQLSEENLRYAGSRFNRGGEA